GLAGSRQPGGAQGAPRRAAAAALPAARSAHDRRDRALMGRRDPVGGPALALQARRRPRRGGGGEAAGGDRDDARRRSGPLREGGRAADPRQAADAAEGPPPRGRAVPALWRDAAGRALRGLRRGVLSARADRGPRAQGPAALAAAQVAPPPGGAPRIIRMMSTALSISGSSPTVNVAHSSAVATWTIRCTCSSRGCGAPGARVCAISSPVRAVTTRCTAP